MKIEQFKKFIEAGGAEILTNTNPYEMIRFRANGTLGVVYKGKRGYTCVGEAEKAFDCFSNKKPWSGAEKNKNPVYLRSVKIRSLFERDGDKCFYCNKELGTDVTIEHLLARNCGGSNHINNLALAHAGCNLKAHHLSVVAKVKLRESQYET